MYIKGNLKTIFRTNGEVNGELENKALQHHIK